MRRSADATGKCAKRRNSVKRDNVVGEFAVDRNSTPADNWSGAGLRPVPAARVDPGCFTFHIRRFVPASKLPLSGVFAQLEESPDVGRQLFDFFLRPFVDIVHGARPGRSVGDGKHLSGPSPGVRAVAVEGLMVEEDG